MTPSPSAVLAELVAKAEKDRLWDCSCGDGPFDFDASHARGCLNNRGDVRLAITPTVICDLATEVEALLEMAEHYSTFCDCGTDMPHALRCLGKKARAALERWQGKGYATKWA